MKILCIGRNYHEHALELNNPLPDSPLLFFKTQNALLQGITKYYLPNFSTTIDYELELVVHISRTINRHTSSQELEDSYDKLTVGLDFTERNLQAKLKAKGWPWELAKTFDGSALIGEWVDRRQFSNPDALNLQLWKNKLCVQEVNSSARIYSTLEILSYASQYFTLEPGDLLFTGTPKGVGQIMANDILTGFLEGQQLFSIQVLPPHV